jgi:predicted dehydrogenase
MLSSLAAAGTRLAVNWPLRWYPAHVTTKRLIDEGVIGNVVEVHFYDGNRGPLHDLADKIEVSDEQVLRRKPTSWWYKKASGGGSLLDYLGYGATLGTWFMDRRAPLTVTTVTSSGEDIKVDEHCITVCRYDTGPSKFETRWGTFTDPWTTQPQPKCGFVVVETAGTITSYDFEPQVGLQTRAEREVGPSMSCRAHSTILSSMCFTTKETGSPITGPLEPVLCRTAQRIIDTAQKSAEEQKTLQLLP